MIGARLKSVVRFCWNQYSLSVCIWNLNVVLSSSRICYFWSTWKRIPQTTFLGCLWFVFSLRSMKPIVVDMSIPMDVQALVQKSGGETELFHPSPQPRWTYAKQSWVVRWSAQMYFSRRRPPKICDQWSLDIVREGDSHKWTWGSGLGVDCHWMILHVLKRSIPYLDEPG